jgi:hypothetical protein
MGFRRTRTHLAISAVVLGASLGVLFAREARATDCSGTLSTCINDDTLFVHPGAGRFVGVAPTETIAPGQAAFGLVTTYLSRPIILHTPTPLPTGTDQDAINDQVNGSFLFAYGVSDRLQLDLVLPVTFGQGGTGVAPITGGAGIQDTAMRDVRLGMAFALVTRPRMDPRTIPGHSFAITAHFDASAPTGDRSQFAGERTAVWLPSLAIDWRSGRWFAGAEVGARLRPVTELSGARIGTQAVLGLGAGVDVLDREMLSLVAEARALPTFADQFTLKSRADGTIERDPSSAITPAEWMFSARTAPILGGDLALQLGGGGAIPLSSGGDASPTTPRFRFVFSVRYAPVARDTDGDGILDHDDKCPGVRAPHVPGQPADGCPHAAPTETSTAPAAQLRLAPSNVCATEPDSVDGFRDNDGCPDEDSDNDGIPNRLDKCPLVSEDFAGASDGCPEKK